MKTIKIIAATIFIITSYNGSAQDTIYFKNGEKKIALIHEVGTDIINYKNYYNQNGPDYKTKKSEIVSISYKNGYKEIFSDPNKEQSKKPNTIDYKHLELNKYNRYVTNGSQISIYEAWRLMSLKRNEKINLHLSKAKQANAEQHIFGWGAIPIGIAALVFYEASVPETQYSYNGGVSSSTTSAKTNANKNSRITAIGLGILTAASVGTSIYMNFEKKSQTEKARKIYNEMYFNY